MLNQIHPNKIRQFLFLSVIALLGFVLVKELYFFLNALLGAITLYVILRNIMLRFVNRWKWKKWLAATTLILLSFVVFVIPFLWLSTIVVKKIAPIVQNQQLIRDNYEKVHVYLLEKFNLDILNEENVSNINSFLVSFARDTIGSTINGLGTVMFMYVLLFFMLIQSAEMERWLRLSIPFQPKNVNFIIKEVRNLIFSNALGIPIVAVIQGFAGLIGYWIFGVEEFILMGILTAISSAIPLVGIMLVYIPLMLFELSSGDWYGGIGVGLWGVVVIGSVDNLARLLLQRKLADVHPLVTLFGALIGLKMFGFIGVIFGPIMLSTFILLVRIYLDEYGKSVDEITEEKQSTTTK